LSAILARGARLDAPLDDERVLLPLRDARRADLRAAQPL